LAAAAAGGSPAAAVSGRGGSGGIGSGGGDNDIGFGEYCCMCGVCVRTCQLQHVAEQHVRHNHAYFYFWQGSGQTFFLAAKVPNFFFGSQNYFWQLARGNSSHSNWVQFFGGEKRLWQNSAKNKSWQTQSSFLLFARTHCHSLCKDAHATHTTEKHTKSTTHPSSHHIQTSDTLHTPHLAVPEAPGTSVNVNMLPLPSPDRRRRPEK